MPLFLLIAGIAGAAYFAAKPGLQVTPGVTPTTPTNSGQGITTGFGQPQTATQATPVPTGTQSNVPSPAASGVPDYASTAQLFSALQASTQPSPGHRRGQQQFYAGTQPATSQPNFINAVRPRHHKQGNGNCSCGGSCGGSSQGCPMNKSNQFSDYSNPGNLAATPAAQTANAAPSDIAAWHASFQGQNVSGFETLQNNALAAASTSSPGGVGDHQEPASPWNTPIGVAAGPYGHR